ncbi:ABC transporter ATP-binding protein [Crenobacter cavernae]|uniref:ABC transporter ATP-binding protein n=1 Tax=Crenobacter cavernae TaxID=2290923 RepID=A0ABY0F9E1_9NEIS|nr:ABC transporter ATP-binding protein [Crenobacter cavernae]RXZ42096.1 ABC transporter ATP-binding protein [Crenobacter cavernae]
MLENNDWAFEASGLAVKKRGRTLLSVDALQLPARKVSAIIGANGAGKTTLLRALAGFVPAGGAVRFFGGQPCASGRGFAWVGQHEGADSPMTVHDYVALGRRPRLGWFGVPGGEDRQAVEHALLTMEVAHLADSRMAALSGGERQRTAVARALAQGTPAVFLDEPTNHLDLRHQHLLMRTLSRLAHEGRSIVTVLHDLALAANYADHLVLMKDGEVLASGSPETVLCAGRLLAAYRWPIKPCRDAEGRWRFDAMGTAWQHAA